MPRVSPSRDAPALLRRRRGSRIRRRLHRSSMRCRSRGSGTPRRAAPWVWGCSRVSPAQRPAGRGFPDDVSEDAQADADGDAADDAHDCTAVVEGKLREVLDRLGVPWRGWLPRTRSCRKTRTSTAPGAGFEPAANALTVRRSAAELSRIGPPQPNWLGPVELLPLCTPGGALRRWCPALRGGIRRSPVDRASREPLGRLDRHAGRGS